MLYDKYKLYNLKRIFEIVFDSAVTIARHNHYCIKRSNVEEQNAVSLVPPTIR